MKRNLIAHFYPRSCGKWRRSVDHLLARWSQFNGRKIISIAVDDTTDPAYDVQEAFGASYDVKKAFGTAGKSVEWIVRDNEKGLQEIASFLPMLEMIESHDPDEATFYCHSKGCTHESDDAASHLWADAMFSTLLDFPALTECAMRRYGTCGSFRSHGLWPHVGYYGWHFAGTFYWFKHDVAFSLNWRNIIQTFYGAEAWPGMFPMNQSACLFFDRADTGHLYSVPFWRSSIVPALRRWLITMRECGQTGGIYLPADSRLKEMLLVPEKACA